MATLKNTTQAPITVHGKSKYDFAPGQSGEVDSATNWEHHPYVICEALVIVDDAKQPAPEANGEGSKDPDPAKTVDPKKGDDTQKQSGEKQVDKSKQPAPDAKK